MGEVLVLELMVYTLNMFCFCYLIMLCFVTGWCDQGGESFSPGADGLRQLWICERAF